jgi:hypothetical protein
MTLRQPLIVCVVFVPLALMALAQQLSKAPAAIRPIPSAVTAQHDRIQRLLPPAIKQRIDMLLPAFRDEIAKLPPRTDFRKLAEADVRRNFPHASPQQTDVLVFTLLKQTADGMSDVSEMTSMRLQMAMDRRSKFIETLSNVMKSVDETNDSVISNLK